MNKRGQFYIIIVLVLALSIYGITYKSNTVNEYTTFEDFEDVSQNYLTESKMIVNEALQAETLENPLNKLDTFTDNFLTYAQTRDPGLELLYMYSDGTDIVLKNYLGNSVESNTLKKIGGAGQEILQEITINIGGKPYTYQIPVSLGDFGEEWYSGELPLGFIDLNIGGITHNFNFPTNSDEFKVIIKTENHPEGLTMICQDNICN